MDKLPQDFVQTLEDNPLILFVVEQVLVNYNALSPVRYHFQYKYNRKLQNINSVDLCGQNATD